MAQTKFFSERISIIDEILSDKIKISKTDLINRINEKLSDKGFFDRRNKREQEISEKTFHNDIKYLRYKGAPIKCEHGRYFYSEKFSLSCPQISKEDAQKLHNAVALLKQLDVVPQLQDIETLIAKLENASRIENVEDDEIVQFEHHALLKGLTDNFDIIYFAIANKHELRVTYKRFINNNSKTYLFQPYLLKEYHNLWYVFGVVKGKTGIIALAIDRIENVVNAKISFNRVDEFSAKDYFKNLVGITMEGNPQPQKVELRVTKQQAAYFINQPLHTSQKVEKKCANGDIMFSLNVIVNVELKYLLMQYANTLRIIQPKSLREEICQKLKAALKLNNKK